MNVTNMMFPFGLMPTLKTIYVVLSTFNNTEWYLADVERDTITVIRKWTSNAGKAIQFDKKEDAETMALLVCDGTNYKISGIVKNK